MKKLFLIILSITMLLSSSPWEGAAAVAPDGELPSEGMFAATNSFPVNTVVDITNIETGKSTRVIVAKGLDSPGLLAIVSREAAELIGMRQGSVSRLRMVQPADPIAYLRFIEGQAAGIPGYDSGDILTEEDARRLLYADDSYTPPFQGAVAPREPGGVTGPSYLLEPEWQNRGEEIVTIPGYNDPVFEDPRIEEPAGIAEDYGEYYEIYDELEYYAEELYEEEDEFIAEKELTEEEIDEYIAEDYNEYLEDYSLYDELEYYAEELYEEEEKFIAEEEPEYIVEYNLVPAEERPPESIYGIDLNDIIPEIIIPEIANPAAPDTASFSVPRVTELDFGSYYVQIASLDTPEMVESALDGIDRSYKPVVYKDGDNWYRILLGPMNQGESAAVLARFKSIGYQDAFVRHAR